MEQNEANMETLAKELISAENEKFVYNPAERRDKTHGASLVSSEETTVRSTGKQVRGLVELLDVQDRRTPTVAF